MKYKIKKPARHTSIHQRHLSLNSNEQVFKRKLKKTALSLYRSIQMLEGEEIFNNSCKLFFIVIIIMVNLTIIKIPANVARPDRKRTVESFTEDECWNFFETKKEDLPRLLYSWRIPDKVTLPNGSTLPGEEVMLRALYELVSGEDQYNIAVNVFGRDQSHQSRVFTWFTNHIYDNFHDLVHNNLDWYFNFLEQYMQLVGYN